VPPCGREHANRARLGTLERPGQVTNHTERTFGQSQLDRKVQIFLHIIKAACNLKDRHLRDRASPDPWYRPTGSQSAGCLLLALWQHVWRKAGGEHGDITVEN